MSAFHDEAEQPLLVEHHQDDNGSQVDVKSDPDRFRASARVVGCCFVAASAGWHDGCIGALIPYLQVYYGGVSDEKVALVFIGSFTGYILASLLNVTLSNRLGLGRLIVLGACAQGLASAVIAFRPPFIAIAICYAVAGFGLALQDAQFNTYIARLPGAPTKLGVVHAIYGIGALLSPAAATLLMRANLPPPLFYLTNLAWCIASLGVLLLGFGFGGGDFSGRQTEVEADDRVASLKTVVSDRVVWAALMFVSLYTGSETSEAGWIVSFLMRERDGGSMSGYASSAFYTGLTSGRVVLLPLTAVLNDKRAVTLYAALALAMQVVVWTSPVFLVDFIAVAACGFVMGPVYPVTVSLVTKATPHGYHPGALSLMASVGQSGSAFLPFLVGTLAESFGIGALQPVLIAMFALMILLWQLVPSPEPGSLSSQSSVGSKPASILGSADSITIIESE